MEPLFDIHWRRLDYPEHGLLVCHKLTYKKIVRRLSGAIKNSGPVVIEKVVRSNDRAR